MPEKFTFGVSLRDTTKLLGYLYTITPSRRPEAKAYFPMQKSVVSPSNLSETRALTYADPAGQVFYVLVYSGQSQKERFPSTLAKIYGGLAWKVDYPLVFTPTELVISPDTGELVIRNATQQTVVDKNGKVRGE